ncbi:MAG: hypothetical protein JWM76_1481 [Pseudonocardiales bacterium]|nr:hypothetical protein [Pseudonocardiales bacterium]
MALPLVAVARSAALGLAVGGRASAGFAALTASASKSDPDWLRSRPALFGSAAMSVGEAIGDKLPKTPSRLEPGGVVSRLVVGALAGGLLGRRHGASVLIGGAAGMAGAFAGTHAGARWRALASTRRGGPDLPGALAEDAVVAGLAYAAVR